MKMKLLPLIKNPPIIALQHHAFYLGVLFTKKHYVHYFHSNFINLYYSDNVNPNFNFILEKYYAYESYIKKLDMDCPLEKTELLNLIIKMLNSGFYVSGIFNEYYVPRRRATYKYDFDHDFLIYGYSVECEELYAIGYTEKGLYEKTKIDFYSFCKAIYSTSIDKKWVRFFKIIENYEFNFCINRLKSALHNYVVSAKVPVFNYSDSYEFYYGTSAITKFVQSITKCKPQSLRYYRIILEHKNCMLSHIQYLTTQGFLEKPTYEAEYKDVVKNAEVIFNLAIKYSIVPGLHNNIKMQDMLLKMIELENKVLEGLLREL